MGRGRGKWWLLAVALIISAFLARCPIHVSSNHTPEWDRLVLPILKLVRGVRRNLMIREPVDCVSTCARFPSAQVHIAIAVAVATAARHAHTQPGRRSRCAAVDRAGAQAVAVPERQAGAGAAGPAAM